MTLSSWQALVAVGGIHPPLSARSTSKAENPIAPGLLQPCAMYADSAVKMLRVPATAAASLAYIFARTRFGIAIAATIRMIATTISSSINENPFCLRMSPDSLSRLKQFAQVCMASWLPFPQFLAPDPNLLMALLSIQLLAENDAN